MSDDIDLRVIRITLPLPLVVLQPIWNSARIRYHCLAALTLSLAEEARDSVSDLRMAAAVADQEGKRGMSCKQGQSA